MAVYYVGPSGSDANSGLSWALRKLTIQAAVNVATTAGDSVLVAPGTYRETVTMGTSGTAGNVISLIGDYTGANTSGTKGVVRITASADDIALTRANCIVAASKNYIDILGFLCDLSLTAAILIDGCTYVNVSKCAVSDFTNSGVLFQGAANSNCSATSLYVSVGIGSGISCAHASQLGSVSLTIQNCIVVGGTGSGNGIIDTRVSGVSVKNCIVMGCNSGIRLALLAGTVAPSVTVTNCIVAGCARALDNAFTVADFTEDYNTVFGCSTARTNVSAGANSVARPPLFDPRWFFEAVNGGRLVTPFDLASYSTLVELNSGTGAPATDLRGASVVGTYREWGALEYSANNRAQGPVSIAPIGGIG